MAKAGDLDALQQYEQRKKVELIKQNEAAMQRDCEKKYMKK